MIDTMCTNYQCPSSMNCLRFVALPDEDTQAYAQFEPKGGQEQCDQFILAQSMREEK